MDKVERINAKKTELMETFRDLSDDQLKVAADLISQAAFMAVTLEDLADSITENGTVEEYTNGANQSGRKISSDAKLYSSLIAKYTQIVSKLLPMVPGRTRSQSTAADEARKRAEHEARKAQAAMEERRERENTFLWAVASGKLKKDDYKAYMNGDIEIEWEG